MTTKDRVAHFLAKTIIVKTKVPEDIAAWRLTICQVCEHRDTKENKCLKCGCFLDLKVVSEVNWRISKNRNEITHCPEGKWNDKAIANEYRRIDGIELLN